MPELSNSSTVSTATVTQKLSNASNGIGNQEVSFMETYSSHTKKLIKKVPVKRLLNSSNSLLNNLLSENFWHKFTIKFAANTTALHMKSVVDKKRVSDALNSKKVPYWTHINKEERSHAFVLYSFECQMDIEEIHGDITRRLPQLLKVFKMNTANRQLYLVITGNSIKLQDIEHIIPTL